MSETSKRHLRRFGLTVGGVFLTLGTVSWLRDHVLAPRILWTVGALLVLPGAVAPELLGPVERVWMRGAAALGHINSRVILTLVYYLIVTPVGVLVRLFRDPLNLRRRDFETNWTRRPSAPVDPARYQQQF
jgi:hypothetical protein